MTDYVFVFFVIEVFLDEFFCFGVGGVAGAEIGFVEGEKKDLNSYIGVYN